MKLIAHRGNINGKNPKKENNPDYILDAIQMGYDAEIDVWYINNQFYLGHDEPQYQVTRAFLKDSRLWCHAKNFEALDEMLRCEIHCFFHQTDDCTLTSQCFIWVFPGKPLMSNAVCVMPENADYSDQELLKCFAICTDQVADYKRLIIP